MTHTRLLIAISTSGILLAACSGEDFDPSDSQQAQTQGGAMNGFQTAGAAGMLNSGGTSPGGAPNMPEPTGGVPGAPPTSGGAGGDVSMGGSDTGMGGADGGSAGEGGAADGGAGGASEGGMGGGGNPDDPRAIGNDPVPSAGCGSPAGLMNGKHTISSNGQDRTYIIDIPDGYDMNTPHRMFYTSHWIGARSEDVQGQNYYFLKPLAQRDGVPAIFVAPQSDGATWQEKDHALFDDILAEVKESLCIDTSRVFATGFSFGGMITYSLSVNHQSDIRAAVGIAPANYNIYVPPKTGEPIAWMQTTGMSDGTCPWDRGNGSDGAKYIALEHATDNGCDVPNDIPTVQQGAHVCYDFEGCPAEFPTKACTFNGDHTNINSDPGSNENWIASESWDFFMQF